MSGGKKRVKKVYPKPVVPGDDRAPGENCVYCGKAVDMEDRLYTPPIPTRRFPVCSEACRSATERYVRADKRHKTILYLVLLVCAVVILVTALTGRQTGLPYYITILLAGTGFAAFPYPITSFETFQSCPIKRVTLLCRVLGIALAVFALVLILLT